MTGKMFIGCTYIRKVEDSEEGHTSGRRLGLQSIAIKWWMGLRGCS